MHRRVSPLSFNWKFVHCHLLHLDFCWQYRHILLGYNTRIRNFWYLVSHIFCFSFCLLFYLDGMFAVEKYKLLLLWLVKNKMHQTKCTVKKLRPFWMAHSVRFSYNHCGFTACQISRCGFLVDVPMLGQNKVNLHTTIKTKFGNLMRT